MLGFETQRDRRRRAPAWLGRVHADDRAALEAALARHLTAATPRFEHEMRLRAQGRQRAHVLSRGVAIRSDSGTPYRMVGLDTDVTA